MTAYSNARVTGIVVAGLVLALTGWLAFQASPPHAIAQPADYAEQSPLLRSLNRGTIVAGYGGYLPYTVENPATGEVTGLSVDLMNEIASQLKIKVTWKKFNWSTMSADLKRGGFVVIADPIFQTIPRAREFSFTEPFAFSPTGVAIIRQGGERYGSMEALNKPSIKVAVGQGLAEETLLRTRAPNADIIAVPVGSDTAAAANLVISGRADAAILTLSDAKRFLAANPGRLEGLWMDKPPAYMPAGFALSLGDQAGVSFLNVAIRNLKYNGTLGALAKRYGIEDDFQLPGSGP